MKSCKVCKTRFDAGKASFRRWCSPECGAILAQQLLAAKRAKEQREERKADRMRKRQLDGRPGALKRCQDAFNAMIRERDFGLACISCGRYSGQMHAGHYLSRGARPELAFNEDNVHIQCAQCNNIRSGNAVLYRLALVERIGLERVEALEGPHPPLHLGVAELDAMAETFRARTRAMRRERQKSETSCAV